LVSIGLLGTTTFGWLVPTVALGLVAVQWRRPPVGVVWARWLPDGRDLRAIAVFYVGIVVLFRLAFSAFTVDRVAGLFLSFAAGLILGVAGPVVYTVWRRQRPLSDLGISRERLPATVALALGFGAAQFAVTLLGYDLPRPVDWVPLLVMALVVGIFETIFFRGFVQNRLEASAGTLPGLAGAAVLYSLYHVGYGMGAGDLLFLFGLGAVYAMAFRLVRNGLVLWPLLTPLGSFFANVDAGEIHLPWASIAGFVDVTAIMATVIVLAHRHWRRTSRPRRPHGVDA
jgi:membrane protease YdiL (CAAX protease family)